MALTILSAMYLWPEDGGVAIQLSLSKGDGNVGGTVNIGQLLFVVVQLAEVVAPAGQQGHRVGGTDDQDLASGFSSLTVATIWRRLLLLSG